MSPSNCLGRLAVLVLAAVALLTAAVAGVWTQAKLQPAGRGG